MQQPTIARDWKLSFYHSMRLAFVILLLCISVAASQETSNKPVTLAWDASPKSDKVTAYRVYELVKSRLLFIGQTKSRRLFIGQTKTTRFVIPRKKGTHVYVVTAVSAKGESAPSNFVQVRN
jgi:hypothetical protein